MSRIGKKPLQLADGVSLKVEGNKVTVSGKKGELHVDLPMDKINIEEKDGVVTVTAKSEDFRNFQGMARSILENMVEGVTNGYKRELVIHGVGYKAQVKGKTLVLSLGFSHPVEVNPPEGVTFSMNPDDNLAIFVEGIDIQKVGQVAANIRAIRPPEPYKGKGVRYRNEHIIRKAGKSTAK